MSTDEELKQKSIGLFQRYFDLFQRKVERITKPAFVDVDPNTSTCVAYTEPSEIPDMGDQFYVAFLAQGNNPGEYKANRRQFTQCLDLSVQYFPHGEEAGTIQLPGDIVVIMPPDNDRSIMVYNSQECRGCLTTNLSDLVKDPRMEKIPGFNSAEEAFSFKEDGKLSRGIYAIDYAINSLLR